MKIHPNSEKLKYLLEDFVMDHPYVRTEINKDGDIVISEISNRPEIEYSPLIPKDIIELLEKRDKIDKQIIEKIISLNSENQKLKEKNDE